MKIEEKPENPNAFPSEEIEYYDTPLTTEKYKISHKGMTLRDYYAAKSMQGIMSTYHYNKPLEDIILERIQIAEISYQMADEMLKQR